jgi:hypothetical protein
VLPDYPAIKEKLNKRLHEILKAKLNRHLGPFSQVKTVVLPEGHGTTLTREDGSVSDTPFEHVEVMAESKVDADKINHEDVNRLLDELAEKLADKKIKQFFDVTNKAVEEIGNSLKRQPGESMIDSYFRSLERILIEFGDDGTPMMPSLLAGSKTADELNNALHQIETTPELRNRFDGIIERKREELRARESSRNLVG